MSRYHAWITTPMPLDQAFSVLSRFDHAGDWDPGVESGAMVTAAPVGVGSRFTLNTLVFGRTVPFEYEMITYEPGTKLVLRAENAFVRSVDTISFDRLAGATEITYDAQLDPRGLARLAAPFIALAFRRIGDRAADGLRRHLNPADAAPS